VVDGRVFPERSKLVHDRQTEFPPDSQCRETVERRRVGVEDIGLDLRHQRAKAAFELSNHGKLPEYGELRVEPSRSGRAIEAKPLRFLDQRFGGVLGARDLSRLPAEPALLAQDGERPVGVAAQNGRRMVEDVEDRIVGYSTMTLSGASIPSPVSTRSPAGRRPRTSGRTREAR
jgi:hypothetical protein